VGLDPPPQGGTYIYLVLSPELVFSPGQKPSVITRAKSGSAVSGVGARKGICPMEIYKTAKYLVVIFTTGNRPTYIPASA